MASAAFDSDLLLVVRCLLDRQPAHIWPFAGRPALPPTSFFHGNSEVVGNASLQDGVAGLTGMFRPSATLSIQGVTKLHDGTLVSRKVHLFRESDSLYLGSTISEAGTGKFIFRVNIGGNFMVYAEDDSAAPDRKTVQFSRVRALPDSISSEETTPKELATESDQPIGCEHFYA